MKVKSIKNGYLSSFDEKNELLVVYKKVKNNNILHGQVEFDNDDPKKLGIWLSVNKLKSNILKTYIELNTANEIEDFASNQHAEENGIIDYESALLNYMIKIENKNLKENKKNIKLIIKEEVHKLFEKYGLNISTPWGTADIKYDIDTGVIWYGTPSHGGLYVSSNVAKKKLTPQAREQGHFWKGSYWYEEDVAWAIPFYENYDWQIKLNKLNGIGISSKSLTSKKYIKDLINKYMPEYFDEKFIQNSKYNQNIPKINEDDILYFENLYLTIFRYLGNHKGKSMQDFRPKIYKITPNLIKSNLIKIERDGKVIWEKK